MATSKRQVELTALWGNDDASSTIAIPASTWRRIVAGEMYDRTAWAWYEGRRFSVVWSFAQRTVSIDGPDCSQCIVEESIDELQREER